MPFQTWLPWCAMLEPDQGSPRTRLLVWMLWPAYRAEQANANASITVCLVLCWQLLSHQWSSTNVDLTGSQWPKTSNPRKTETQVLCLTLCLFAPAPWDTASLCHPSSTCEVEMVIEIVTLLAKHTGNLWLSPVRVLHRLESCFFLQASEWRLQVQPHRDLLISRLQLWNQFLPDYQAQPKYFNLSSMLLLTCIIINPV